MNVKLGICNFCVPGTGIFAPQFVAEAGLDGMSIEFGTYANHYPSAIPRVRDAYLAAAQEYHITYCNIGCSCFDFIPFIANKGHPMHAIVKDTLRVAVDTAKYMSIPMVFIPSFGVSSITDEDAFDNAVEMFRYLCDYAQEKGVLISSENKMRACKQVELVERVNRGNFSLFYDSYNFFYEKGYDQLEMLKQMYPYMGPQLHVKDGKPGVLAGSLLGEGDSGFYGVMDYLREKDYNGWIISENLYEKQPTNNFETDVFALFLKDIETMKRVTK
ncbi:MAG: sugar phosphate isomerase/epimerase family protein [Eubacteriales bacterium]|nr:sugar phosphate isomerase/epimerase family protein [Eubacteriales bacterium]